MQFLKKRRYLLIVSSNSVFFINVGYMVFQSFVIQFVGVSVLDNEVLLLFIDFLVLSVDIKFCYDKFGIFDEVLQSILDQYFNKLESQKEDFFSITEFRVDLYILGEYLELVQEENLSLGI